MASPDGCTPPHFSYEEHRAAYVPLSERLVFGSPKANRIANEIRDAEQWEKWEREADAELGYPVTREGGQNDAGSDQP